MKRPWRVGRSLGRTIYLDNACVGLVDTPELAASMVGSLNERHTLMARVEKLETELRRACFALGESCPICGWDQPRCECKTVPSPSTDTEKTK